jgi:hypothetical protein
LNPYLNHHRPCAQADVKIDEKGRKRASYKRYQTPLETLSRLDKPGQYLREGLSINALKRVAAAISDTDAARRMQQAKAKLFERLRLTAQDRWPSKRAEEMAAYGKRGKTMALCLSTLPTDLGNRSKSVAENEDRAERFPHSLRPGTNCQAELNSKPERTKPASPTLRFLQAHLSIGKDWGI